MQQVGASARERLIAAAAARWNVAPSECAAAKSVVTHQPSGRTLRYGELATDAAKIKLAGAGDQDPAQFTFIPRPMPRVDLVHKTDGSANSRSTRRSREWFLPPSMPVPCPAAN